MLRVRRLFAPLRLCVTITYANINRADTPGKTKKTRAFSHLTVKERPRLDIAAQPIPRSSSRHPPSSSRLCFASLRSASQSGLRGTGLSPRRASRRTLQPSIPYVRHRNNQPCITAGWYCQHANILNGRPRGLAKNKCWKQDLRDAWSSSSSILPGRSLTFTRRRGILPGAGRVYTQLDRHSECHGTRQAHNA